MRGAVRPINSDAVGSQMRKSSTARRWSRLAPMMLLLVVVTGCSGHGAVLRDIENLDLPGALVEIDETRSGSRLGIFGDEPRITKTYVSSQPAAELCGAMREWASRNGLAEIDSGADSCRFNRSADYTQVVIRVSPTPTEVVSEEPLQGSRLVGSEFGAVIRVSVTHF